MVEIKEPADFDIRLKKARDINNNLTEIKNNGPAEEGKAKAIRISTELIVAVTVGGVIGYFLDNMLETKPWFLLGFLLLGNVAGLWNIYRLINGHSHKIGFKHVKTAKKSKSI
jgi:ATP synthase protein I